MGNDVAGARCAPPVELRDKPGRHWLTREGWGDVVAVWEPDVPCWTWGGEDRDPECALRSGWRYLAPVTTPAEVAALTAEVERLRGGLETTANALGAMPMTTRDKAIEAMARAIGGRGPRVPDAGWMRIRIEAAAALDALLALLAQRGLRIVPAEATEEMMQRVSAGPYAGNWLWVPGDAYAAMVSAAPDPLREPTP